MGSRATRDSTAIVRIDFIVTKAWNGSPNGSRKAIMEVWRRVCKMLIPGQSIIASILSHPGFQIARQNSDFEKWKRGGVGWGSTSILQVGEGRGGLVRAGCYSKDSKKLNDFFSVCTNRTS